MKKRNPNDFFFTHADVTYFVADFPGFIPYPLLSQEKLVVAQNIVSIYCHPVIGNSLKFIREDLSATNKVPNLFVRFNEDPVDVLLLAIDYSGHRKIVREIIDLSERHDKKNRQRRCKELFKEFQYTFRIHIEVV